MKAFAVQLWVQMRMDLRDKGTLMVYYLVPLVFYLVMGSIMKAIAMETQAPLILSITIFALSMSAFLGMPQNLVKAREQGILEAYRAAGIPAWSLPLATVILSTIHMMFIAVVIFVTAPRLFGAALPDRIPLHFLAVVLIALCSEGLGAVLSCLVKKQNTMTLAAQCLFLPSIMFSGIMFPAAMLPKPMQWLGMALPATQGARLLDGGALAAAPLAMLCGLTVLSFAVSAGLFKRIGVRR
ncbi:MAG TPA: ABC transporter permease [Clostridia bacterium]|nr:ABC transporter permease [Clostridia bacterium]